MAGDAADDDSALEKEREKDPTVKEEEEEEGKKVPNQKPIDPNVSVSGRYLSAEAVFRIDRSTRSW